MDIRNCRRQIVALLAAVSVAAAAVAAFAAGPDDPESFSHYVAKDGGITRPADYREKFEHIGTSAVATKPGGPRPAHIKQAVVKELVSGSRC